MIATTATVTRWIYCALAELWHPDRRPFIPKLATKSAPDQCVRNRLTTDHLQESFRVNLL